MIEIKNLTVAYGENKVYDNFNLSFEEGRITCILGESGCGKTTLLNAVASLIKYSGEITPLKCSYVFQTPRLIPYITVLKNLTVTGAGEEQSAKMLERVGLGDKLKAFPQSLSGGERQRVALCRSFLYESDIFLLDEPFSSLDLKTKLSVMDLFKNLQREKNRTALFVTHDIDEALYLADRLIVFNVGIAADIAVDDGEKRLFGKNSVMRQNVVDELLK